MFMVTIVAVSCELIFRAMMTGQIFVSRGQHGNAKRALAHSDMRPLVNKLRDDIDVALH